MNRADVPVLRRLAEVGPRDPVFDSLLLLGPVLIVVIAFAGRTTATTLLMAGYLLAFLLHTAYKAVSHRANTA